MPDPLTLALLALVAALLRGDRARAEEIMGRLEADGALTPLLEVGAVINRPNLVWEEREVTTTPRKLYDANPSQRRRVIIMNTTGGILRIAHAAAPLQGPSGGGQLVSGAILIDEPPEPHGGEWWAVATVTQAIPVAQQE